MGARLLLIVVLSLAATSTLAQERGRSARLQPPPSSQSLTSLRVQPQAQVETLRAPRAQGAPANPANIAPLSAEGRALAVQQLTGAATPPQLSQTFALTVDAPVAANGASLDFFLPRLVVTGSNSAMFEQFIDPLSGMNFSHVFIDHPNWPTGLHLFDCAISSGSPTFQYKILTGGIGSPIYSGQVALIDGHLLFVATMAPIGGVVISNTVPMSEGLNGRWYFHGCEITRIAG